MPTGMLPIFKIWTDTVFSSKLAQESKNNTATGQLRIVWTVQHAKVKNTATTSDLGLAGGDRYSIYLITGYIASRL